MEEEITILTLNLKVYINSFLYLFWDWVRLYIEGGSLSFLDFVDWVGSR